MDNLDNTDKVSSVLKIELSEIEAQEFALEEKARILKEEQERKLELSFVSDRVAPYNALPHTDPRVLVEAQKEKVLSIPVKEAERFNNEIIGIIGPGTTNYVQNINAKRGINKVDFINLYCDQSRPYEVGETVYFCAFNITEPHRPILCQGFVVDVKMNETFERTYTVSLDTFEEPIKFYDKYVKDNIFMVSNNKGKNDIKIYYRNPSNLKDLYFITPSFFVKKNWEDIIYVRNLYIQVVFEELKKDMEDLIDIQNLGKELDPSIVE